MAGCCFRFNRLGFVSFPVEFLLGTGYFNRFGARSIDRDRSVACDGSCT